jgi:hypothetical protein
VAAGREENVKRQYCVRATMHHGGKHGEFLAIRSKVLAAATRAAMMVHAYSCGL